MRSSTGGWWTGILFPSSLSSSLGHCDLRVYLVPRESTPLGRFRLFSEFGPTPRPTKRSSFTSLDPPSPLWTKTPTLISPPRPTPTVLRSLSRQGGGVTECPVEMMKKIKYPLSYSWVSPLILAVRFVYDFSTLRAQNCLSGRSPVPSRIKTDPFRFTY